ncbi:hypothetical protein NC651_000263 [Populus alba x Populus x berolinensis]|nr:hypothetical protein NC651_000263 [Populus alba x Populus x berolinensis]
MRNGSCHRKVAWQELQHGILALDFAGPTEGTDLVPVGAASFMLFSSAPEQYLAWTSFFSVCFELLDVLCIGNFIDQGIFFMIG